MENGFTLRASGRIFWLPINEISCLPPFRNGIAIWHLFTSLLYSFPFSWKIGALPREIR